MTYHTGQPSPAPGVRSASAPGNCAAICARMLWGTVPKSPTGTTGSFPRIESPGTHPSPGSPRPSLPRHISHSKAVGPSQPTAPPAWPAPYPAPHQHWQPAMPLSPWLVAWCSGRCPGRVAEISTLDIYHRYLLMISIISLKQIRYLY